MSEHEFGLGTINLPQNAKSLLIHTRLFFADEVQNVHNSACKYIYVSELAIHVHQIHTRLFFADEVQNVHNSACKYIYVSELAIHVHQINNLLRTH